MRTRVPVAAFGKEKDFVPNTHTLALCMPNVLKLVASAMIQQQLLLPLQQPPLPQPPRQQQPPLQQQQQAAINHGGKVIIGVMMGIIMQVCDMISNLVSL